MSGLKIINHNLQINNILLSIFCVCQDVEKHFMHITLHRPHGMEASVMAGLELRKQRPTGLGLTQGRMAAERQKWGLNPDEGASGHSFILHRLYLAHVLRSISELSVLRLIHL